MTLTRQKLELIDKLAESERKVALLQTDIQHEQLILADKASLLELFAVFRSNAYWVCSLWGQRLLVVSSLSVGLPKCEDWERFS